MMFTSLVGPVRVLVASD